MNNISCSFEAISYIEIILQKNNSNMLRISLRAGKCNGFYIDLECCSSIANTDIVIDVSLNRKILIDAKSYKFLEGMRIEYKNTLMFKGFDFIIPKAKSKCGCGESINF